VDGWAFLDGDKKWVVSGYSRSPTSPAPRAHHRAPAQSDPLLQKSDAPHLGVDSSATSLTGYATRLWLNKEKVA